MQKIKADKEQQNLKRKESVQSLGVIGSDNQTSILSLGTDGNHVEMATGRTLEEEYFSIIEGMSQEYTSNGEPITINNGLKARLVGAEITGNTKRLDADGNECEAGTEGARLVSTEACISNNGIKYPFYQQYIEGETVVQKRAKGSSSEWVTIPQDETRDIVANEYRLYSASGLSSIPSVVDKVDLASGIKIENTKEVVLDGSENWSIIDATKANTLRFECTTALEGKLAGNFNLICDNFEVRSNADVDIEGSSTNGSSTYPCQMFIRIAKSKLTTQDVGGFRQWLQANPVTVRYQLATPTQTQLTDEQLAQYAPYKKQILLGGTATKKDTLTLNSDGSLVWTQNTKDADDGSSRVDLDAPITQTVDKSINQPVLTDQSNVLSGGEAVGCSSLKVKVPVDVMAKINRLEALHI